MNKALTMIISLAGAAALFGGCSATRSATVFNGLDTPEGRPIAHLNTCSFGIHLLGARPLMGDATLEKTVDRLTLAAKKKNATRVTIVQSNVRSWWFILPPFTFVLTPVTSDAAGTALP